MEFDRDPEHLSDEPPIGGLPIPIITSSIVAEMIRVVGEMGVTMIRDLVTAIIHDGRIPTDWEQSSIVCFYQSKGDALKRGNY